MVRLLAVLGLVLVFFGRAALAQQSVWIQVEAQPTLREASERARGYATRFGDVAGFAMTTGWYAIVLGPYPRDEAGSRLSALRMDGLIPADSYINTGANFRQRFWPVGARLDSPTPAPLPGVTSPGTAAPGAAVGLATPGTSLADARADEAALDQAGREELQAALRWKRLYDGPIDGAFGPGTRGAMAEWQATLGEERTGVLTTAQRRALFDAYEADMSALGLTTLRDETAGIEMQIPGAMVAFAGYDPPLARYGARDDSGVELLLISQRGTPARLAALYDVLQSLDIVPTEGARGLTAAGFTLNGRNETRAAYGEAELVGGEIKGFLLSWPRRDDGRIARVLPVMRSSFRAIPGAVLPPTAGGAALPQARDLLAGLDLRRPDRVRSGFFATPAGAVVTSRDAVAGCGRITILDGAEVDLAFDDPATGLAVLRPRGALAPLGHARFRADPPRIDSEIAVAGFAYGDALNQPVLSFGDLADLRDLDGSDARHRLAVEVEPGDAGGPVLDQGGAVLGLLQPRPETPDRILPGGVNFATPAAAILAALQARGLRPETAGAAPSLPPEDLTRLAADMTVMVSCWN